MEVHHQHKPVRNWREFAKEVGIIVLGVVIALGGEQTVEAIHHRSEVREARQALNEELAFDMGAMQYEVQLVPCLNARLAELGRWRQSWKAGHPLKLIHEINVPPNRNFRTNTWRTAAGPAIALMPLRERVAYSKFYDSVETLAQIKDASWGGWADLNRFTDAAHLSDEQLAQMRFDIGEAGTFNNVAPPDYALWVSQFAPQVGASPKLPAGTRQDLDEVRARFCQPLLAR